MFKDHVEVPGLDKEKSKLDDLINQMRYFKDFIKKLNRMDVISNQSQHQIKNGEMLLANKIQPTALANGLVPVDIDVTPMDNNESKAGNFDLVTLAEENKDSLFYDAWRIWFRYFVSMGYAGWNELWEAVCRCSRRLRSWRKMVFHQV